MNSGDKHPQSMLKKLHFDFRNAKPAFLSVPYCKTGEIRTKPDVERTELSCSESSGPVEHDGVDGVKCVVGTVNSESCKTGQRVTGSAVQVDDDDSDGLATAAHLHSCDAADAKMVSKFTDGNCTFSSVTTEDTRSTDRLLPNRNVPKNQLLPPSNTSSYSIMSSSVCQTNKQTDFSLDEDQAMTVKPKRTDNNIAENKPAISVTDNVVLKPMSLLLKEPHSHNEHMELDLHSTSDSTAGELSDRMRRSKRSLPSKTSPKVLYDDDADDVPLSEKKNPIQSARRVKKLCRFKNVYLPDTMTAASISEEARCKRNKPKVVRTRKRRRKIKSDSEGELWPMQKKLLIMPVDQKFSKPGRSRKRNPHIRRNTLAVMPTRKGCKAVCVKEMELPDLSAKLDAGSADMPDTLNVCTWETDVDDNTVPASACRKWCLDITGADLTSDFDIDRSTKSSNQQKSLVDDKAAEQNASQLMPQHAVDAECCLTNFSSSQETPPPSVASDGFSSRDDPDQFARSDAQEEETRESSSSRSLFMDTKLARYIDGRHFDRLVNGISVQISASLTDETVAQIGKECLRLAKLTKLDVKDLQDQVRLEEIYHRRAKKVMCFVHNSSKEKVKNSAYQQHKNIFDVVPSSAAKCVAKSQRTGDDDIETESAHADAANQQGVLFDSDDGQQPLAQDSDDDTISYHSADDDEVATLNNLTSKPEERSKGNVTETYQGAGRSCINTDGAKQPAAAWTSVVADKIQSQMLDQLDEPTPVDVSLQELTSALCTVNCIDPNTAAMSDSENFDDCNKADLTRHKSEKNIALLHKRKTFCPPDNQPAAVSVQCATTRAVNAETELSNTVAPGTDDTQYIAAVALASLSVATTSQLHFTSQLVPSESESCTETRHRCQTNEEHKLIRRDNNVDSKHSHSSSTQQPTKQSSVNKTVTKTSAAKLSQHSVVRTEHHLKSGERRGHRVSADKQCEHTHKHVGDLRSESTVSKTDSQRSRGQRSHSAEAAGGQKQVAHHGKEKLSTTYSSKSAKHSDNDSSHVSTGNLSKKNTKVNGIASDNPPKNSDHAVSDKTRHRKHRSGSRHSSDKTAVGRLEQKQVGGSNLASCDSSTSKIGSNHHVIDITVGRSDVAAKRENALPLDDTIMTVSASNSTSTSVLCNSSSNHLSVLSQSSSSSALHNVISDAIVQRTDKGVSSEEARISLNYQGIKVSTKSSLPSENPRVEVQTEAVRGTAVHRVISDLNSNNMLKESCSLTSATHKQRADCDVACNTDKGVLMSHVPEDDIVPHSSGNQTVYSETLNSLQSSVILADNTAKSSASPYRELEDIRSPSPMLADMEKDDRDEEIRSPSPCERESPVALFCVVETSWDVRLTSPCEIQSPDGSEDEADDKIEEYSRHCNVCFQHGPVTIPLTIEEAGKRTYNQQLDMT